MSIECVCCKACPLVRVCSPGLRPERIRPNGTIDKNIQNMKLPESCRHNSCEDGKAEARIATGKPSRNYTVTDYSGTPKSINGCAFGTSDKPTEAKEYRIVDTDTNEIYSSQDGIYRPTGQ
jgi:hypothetical protein